jgi:hypothetical protein
LDKLSIAAAQSLLKLAEILVRTRDEMRETIDKMEQLRKVVDGCANTLIDTLKEALLIAYAHASEQDGEGVERPVVDGNRAPDEDGAGTDPEHEKRDEV